MKPKHVQPAPQVGALAEPPVVIETNPGVAAPGEAELEAARRQVVQRLAEEIEGVTRALLAEAQAGNIQAIRLIFEVLGLARQPRLAVAVRNEVKPVLTLKNILGSIDPITESAKGGD